MTRKGFLAIPAALLLGAALYFYGGHTAPATQPPLAALTPQNFSTLENAFNDARADVRLMMLLSPT
jgi:hypothetical protein